HVGIKNFPVYFTAICRVLKPGGLFLNHGITNDEEGWKETLGTRFIQRYIFPDGELETISNVQRAMEHAGLEIWDVEALRPHYVLTLKQWLSRLETQHTTALTYVTEAIYRTWRLYLAGCAAQFERGSIGIYQILAINGRQPTVNVPLTRSDLYR
ncbi:MAG: class I SAM-dependent methyltransferase, partial [Steroidobacter sp.]